MLSSSTQCPLAIVSTDTTALREITWTLSAYGYQGLPFSDWSEQAAWRRGYSPTLLILDARDEQQVEALLATPRSVPYTYRIAFYDEKLLGNPDVLMDLGADDLIRYPLNMGELISCLRRGTRRLEFERRYNLTATFDQQRGVANRRGFTLQLDRKLQEAEDDSHSALVVLGIDYLELIREQHGAAAVENACSLVAEVVYGGLSAQDCRGILEEGVFAVLLRGQSVSEARQFANNVNEQCAIIHGRGFGVSLSGVVLAWPSGDTAEGTIQRALMTLERCTSWGGNQILEIEDLEREYTAWNLKLTGQQATCARHVMEALPLILPLHFSESMSGLGISTFASGPVPPCVPVVDDVGHLVGAIDGDTLQVLGTEAFCDLDEYLEPTPPTLRGDSRWEEVVDSLKSVDRDFMLVVENKKPIGYVTSATIASLRTKAVEESSVHQLDPADCTLSSLVVPLI